ncbi:hypothetical protein SLS60_002844 [Paraconiothyrium brasiliense]|uniref:Uncharacterized protein n=1 Tax=Paraconiothyrium brasiliense TaxID=300254 RepID=A0ABR3RU24_9PLEO
MAAPAKLPRALLSETNVPDETILIHRNMKYENLVKTVYTAFSHTYSRDDHNVHFHVASEDFRGGRCRAVLFPDLWEDHEYLTGEITDDGELRVWAHFVRKPQEQEELAQETASVAESEDPIQADFRPDGNVERLLASFRKPRRSNRARDSVAPYRRSESRRESTTTIDEDDGPVYHKAIPRYNPDVHPALPEDATPDNYAKDLQAEKNNNSKDEFKTTSTHMSQLNKEYQRKVISKRQTLKLIENASLGEVLFAKKTRIRCVKEKGKAQELDRCTFSGPKTRSVGNTPNKQNANSTPHGNQSRAHSEGNTFRPRSRDGSNQHQNQIGSSLSPTTSRDDHHEDTVVPLEGRILRDAQGKFIFIGDCAPLSFLQTVRYLISSEVDPDGFTVPAARDCIIEIARPTITNRPQYSSVNVHDVPHLVNKYLIATSGLVELFERDDLVRELKAWASGILQHSDDAAAAVFFLVLAIGAQEHDEAKANAWFEHARSTLSENMCNSMNVATVQGFALVAIYMLRAFQPNGAYLYFCIHRTEVNASFGDSIRTMRDRIWKSLRVVDMLISTNLGRPPCTSDVDCTVKYSVMQMNNEVVANILDASVQIFMIIERVVVEVYSRKRISLRIADFVSRQLKGWASNWLQPLTEAMNSPNRNDLEHVALVGACSTLCSYYYGIMLLTRPFLIYEIYNHMGASVKGARTQGDHANRRKYADAALDAATSFVDTLQTVIRTGALPHRMPLIV